MLQSFLQSRFAHESRSHSGLVPALVAFGFQCGDVLFFVAEVLFADLEREVHEVVLEHLLVRLLHLHAFEGAGAVVHALHKLGAVAGSSLGKDAFVHDGVFEGTVVAELALVLRVGEGGHLLDDAFVRDAVHETASHEPENVNEQGYCTNDDKTL